MQWTSWGTGSTATVAALILLSACNRPAPVESPPPPPEPAREAAPPPPAEPMAPDHGLLGGPPPADQDDSVNGLTTFRRADGLLVTVMRPIPNPEDQAPRRAGHGHRAHAGEATAVAGEPRHGRRHRHHDAAGRTTPAHPLAPSHPLPPPKTVEHPKPVPVPSGANSTAPVTPVTPPAAGTVTPPATAPAPAASGSWLDQFSQKQVAENPTSRSVIGAALVLLAMVILVAISRRMDANRRRAAQERKPRTTVFDTPAALPATPPPAQAEPAPARPPEPGQS